MLFFCCDLDKDIGYLTEGLLLCIIYVYICTHICIEYMYMLIFYNSDI